MSDERMFPDYVNWDYFTNEERTYVQKVVELGDFDNLASSSIINFSGEYSVLKEKELEHILSREKPKGSGFQSRVRTELEKLRGKFPGQVDETPEKEKYWEARLRAEFQAFKDGKLTPDGAEIGEFKLPDFGSPPGLPEGAEDSVNETPAPRARRGRPPKLTVSAPPRVNKEE